MQALALTPGTDRVLNSRAQAAFSTNPDLIAYLGYTLGGKGAPLEWENGLLADWAPAGPTAAVLDMITIRNTTTGASTRELDNQPGRAKGLGSSKGMPGRLQDNTGFLSANLDVGYDLSDSLRLVALSSLDRKSTRL